jgi:hypothetical protein
MSRTLSMLPAPPVSAAARFSSVPALNALTTAAWGSLVVIMAVCPRSEAPSGVPAERTNWRGEVSAERARGPLERAFEGMVSTLCRLRTGRLA